MHRNRAELCTVVELQASVGDATKAVRLLQDRVEYRREIAGRRIDDLQHLGRRGLPLKCFALLGQEPRILDGDDRLLGEVINQLDLLVSERPDLLTIERDRSDQFGVLEHRNEDYRAGAGDISERNCRRMAVEIGRAFPKVVDRYDLSRADQLAEKAAWMRAERLVLACTSKRGWHVVERNVLEVVPIISIHGAEIGSANAGCIFQQRLEHGFQLAGR